MNRRLARAIRDGSIDVDSAELGEHLRRTSAEALQVQQPAAAAGGPLRLRHATADRRAPHFLRSA